MLAGFVQLRFHCLCCAHNENLSVRRRPFSLESFIKLFIQSTFLFAYSTQILHQNQNIR